LSTTVIIAQQQGTLQHCDKTNATGNLAPETMMTSHRRTISPEKYSGKTLSVKHILQLKSVRCTRSRITLVLILIIANLLRQVILRSSS